MNQDEVESQLSAMFDGELPSAECELLSRRIDRDDRLRARWSRYALIGAAMRCEPVATARSDFASRVSRAVDSAVGAQALDTRRRRRNRYVWQSALAASMVAAVAGLSLLMLRQVAWQSASPGLHEVVLKGPHTQGPHTQLTATAPTSAKPAGRAALAAVALRPGVPAGATGATGPGRAATASGSTAREPFSYVTPANDAGDPTALRTELVDYIVAHSEYSTPLMRPDLLSALISGEDAADGAVHGADAGDAGANAVSSAMQPGSSGPASAAASGVAAHSTATAGDADAPTAAAAVGR